MCFHQEIAGKCCRPFDDIEYYCKDGHSPKHTRCVKYICLDGSEASPYCGAGSCDYYGCYCSGGCRRALDTESDAIAKFKREHSNLAFIFVARRSSNPHHLSYKKTCATCDKRYEIEAHNFLI